jgi:hypothetical protein
MMMSFESECVTIHLPAVGHIYKEVSAEVIRVVEFSNTIPRHQFLNLYLQNLVSSQSSTPAILDMKLSALLYASALCTATTAWHVTFHSRRGAFIHAHGTQDATCNTLAWGPGITQGDLDHI